MKVNHFAIRDLDRAVSVSQQGSQHSDVGSFLHDAKHGVDGARCDQRIGIEQQEESSLGLAHGQVVAHGETEVLSTGDDANLGKVSAQHVERFVPRGVIHDDDLDRTVDGVSVE